MMLSVLNDLDPAQTGGFFAYDGSRSNGEGIAHPSRSRRPAHAFAVCLADADPATSLVLMAEVMSEATYVKHHKKKIAFLFSAMRHFAEELREKGFQVRYVTLDDPENTQNLKGELARALAESGASAVIATECGEWRLARRCGAGKRT